MGKILRTLAQQVRPEHAALLVVDMQNDFCAENGFLIQARRSAAANAVSVEATVRIAENIGELATAARNAGMPVVWLCSVYDYKYLADAHIAKRDREGLCLEGSWGADYFCIRPELGDTVVWKHTFSGFHETTLHEKLQVLGVKTLLMTGVATNVCVDSTLREGFFLGYNIVVAEDCVGSGNQLAHEGTLSTVRVNIGTVVDSQALIGLIKQAAAQPATLDAGGTLTST